MAVVAELALGVASNLVFESLKRPLDVLLKEARRHDQMNRALADRPNVRSARLNETLDQAMRDLARVIGNDHGSLSESVATFLADLRRTALLEAIAQAALCGNSPTSLLESFAAFSRDYVGLPFSPEQLFHAVYAACTARFENVADRNLLDIMRAQHSDLSERLEFIANTVHHVFTQPTLQPNQAQDLRIRVAKSIEAAHKLVSVETLQGVKKFRLTSLAIPGRLVELSDLNIRSAKAPPPDAPSSTYLTFRKRFDRAIILGDPGGGKSTLTQMLCYDLANLITLEHQNAGTSRQFEGRDLKLPLRIVLRSFEAKQKRIPSYTFFEHLRDEIKIALDNSEVAADALLVRTLGLGEAVVIFDGLDEVLDVGARRSIVTLIEQFAQVYAACPVLVTSRLVGYRDAPLADEFEAHGLARFNRDEIWKYSEKSIRAVGQVTAKEAKSRAQDFVTQSDKIGGDLRENPLLLGLMVQIFLYRGDVPSNRPEVYRECATLMFEKWDGRRDINAPIPREGLELLDVFGYVASRTFGDAGNEEGVSRAWLIAELRNHFQDWYIDRASANKAASSLVEFLTGRAWVMSEVGQDTFKFTHRTFLEYFFARQLISVSRGVDDLLAMLVPHIVENQWIVIAHLALHMAVFRDGGKARQAAEQIERILSKTTFPPAQELALIEFVSGALEYLLLPEPMYVRLVETVVSRAVTIGARADYGAISVIHSILQTSLHRDGLAVDAIKRQMAITLKEPQTAEFLFGMYVLGAKRYGGHKFPRMLSRNPSSKLWCALEDLRKTNKNSLRRLARQSASIAKAYIYIYDEMRMEAYKIHGSSIIVPSPSPLAPPGVDQALSSALESVSFSLNRGRSEGIEPASLTDSQAFLEALANDIVAGKLQLENFFVEARPADDHVDFQIEDSFRNMWRVSHYSRRTKRQIKGIEDSLVCFLALMSWTSEIGRQRRRGRRNEILIPSSAIEELANGIEDVTRKQWIENWVRVQFSRRGEVAVQESVL